MSERPRKYWDWFFRGEHAGWKELFDRWLLVHLAIGAGMSSLVPLRLGPAAQAILLPLAGIFIGMSFAWVGNALAIAQSVEIERLSEKNPGGYEPYVYSFQTAVLVLLVCLVCWGLAGLGVFDRDCFWNCPAWIYQLTAGALYALASMTLRECWHVVAAAQNMLLYQRAVKRAKGTPNQHN